MQPDEFFKNLENESGNRRQRRKYRSTAAGKIVWKTIFRRKALAERKQSGELFSDNRQSLLIFKLTTAKLRKCYKLFYCCEKR